MPKRKGWGLCERGNMMGRGSEDLEMGIDFEARNKDMEIARLKKKVRKLQKAVHILTMTIESKAGMKWLAKNVDSLMEQEP